TRNVGQGLSATQPNFLSYPNNRKAGIFRAADRPAAISQRTFRPSILKENISSTTSAQRDASATYPARTLTRLSSANSLLGFSLPLTLTASKYAAGLSDSNCLPQL
ncbi:MAG TPA: hypothetical protein VGD13_06190, partial [Xanthobacteraceae bacterium]